MADGTKMIDRVGRRIRLYRKVDPERPGQQERRRMLAVGLKWCRTCRGWLPVRDVGKNGLCRPHANEDERSRYATDPAFNQKRRNRSYARKRGVKPMPPDAAELIAELFDGECAYCDRSYETWDHADPVSRGGRTVEGNMVPCCIRCNSSKKDSALEDWLSRAPLIKPFTIEYLSTIGCLDG